MAIVRLNPIKFLNVKYGWKGILFDGGKLGELLKVRELQIGIRSRV